jgi:hypothetical protein
LKFVPKIQSILGRLGTRYLSAKPGSIEELRSQAILNTIASLDTH